MFQRSKWRTVLCGVLMMGTLGSPLVVDDAVGQDKRGSGSIAATRCRVRLIDEVILASGRTGILAFVEPTEGQQVKKDQKIAGIIDDVAQATFRVADQEANSDVEKRYATKAAEVAKAEWEKGIFTNKRSPGTVPDIELQKLKLAYERSDLQIEQAEHQHKIAGLKRDEAKAILKTFLVEAPFDGVVTKLYKQKGEAVREGDPILEVSSTTRVKVEGFVTIGDLWRIKQGDTVQVQLDIPDVDIPQEKEILEGRITFVDVKVQPVTNEVRVTAEVANRKDILRSGLQAKMTIQASGGSIAAK